MKVINEIKVYEEDGRDCSTIEQPKIIIESHWNYKNRVVIKLPGGKSYTLISEQLIAAIKNAENHK